MGIGYSKRDFVKFNLESIELNDTDFYGNSPPSVFVGRYGYPNVNVGVLSPVKIDSNSWLYDAPKEWALRNYSAREVLKLRSHLVNSRFKSGIKSFNQKLLNIAQEVGMASNPVDMEVKLKNKPSKNLLLNYINSPLGNSADVKNIKLVSNPKIETKVDKVVSDSDMKSVDALFNLYNKGVSENFLSKILSIGLLGLKKNRKLVPTRWSIVGVDSGVGNKFVEEIKFYEKIDSPQAYYGGYMGNYYLILLFPDLWNFELFELEIPMKINPWSKTGKFYATDYEPYDGRKKYAEECGGGFYACRLPITEKLNIIKKQAGIIVFRFITEEDEFPLGVFVCREAVRKSLNNKPIIFSDKILLLNYVRALVKKKFQFDIDNLFKNSKLLNKINHQTSLIEF